MHTLCNFSRFSVILLAFTLGVLTQAAVAAEKAPVKINYVTGSLLVDKRSERSGDLSSISFSIENAANRPLEWVRLRVTVRSPDGALLQTDTFEEDFSNNPIGPKGARRVTHYISIDGFRIAGKQGTIDVGVIDYSLLSEDYERKGSNLNAKNPIEDRALKTLKETMAGASPVSLNTSDPQYVTYFGSIKRSIEI